MTRSRIIEWDGQHLTDELQTLPPGRHLLEALDDGEPLTADEEEGLVEALTALDAGQSVSMIRSVPNSCTRPTRCHPGGPNDYVFICAALAKDGAI